MPPRFGPSGGGRLLVQHGGHDFGWYVLALLVNAVFLAVVLAGAILLVRLLFRPRGDGGPWRGRPGGPPPMMPMRSPAIDELEVRYARGDLGRDDYLQRRADLLAGMGPVPPMGVAPMYGAPPPGTMAAPFAPSPMVAPSATAAAATPPGPAAPPAAPPTEPPAA